MGMAETTEKTSEKKLSVAATKTLTLKDGASNRGWCARVSAMAAARRSLLRRSKAAYPPGQGLRPRPRRGAAQTHSCRPLGRPDHAGRPADHCDTSRCAQTVRSCAAYAHRRGAHGSCPCSGVPGCRSEERKIAEEEAGCSAKAVRNVERRDRDAAEARKAEEERRRKHELETKLKAEQEAKKRFGEESNARQALGWTACARTR